MKRSAIAWSWVEMTSVRPYTVPRVNRRRPAPFVAITEHSPASGAPDLPDARIEAAVLAALTARRSQPMFLVLANGEAEAAEVLGFIESFTEANTPGIGWRVLKLAVDVEGAKVDLHRR